MMLKLKHSNNIVLLLAVVLSIGFVLIVLLDLHSHTPHITFPHTTVTQDVPNDPTAAAVHHFTSPPDAAHPLIHRNLRRYRHSTAETSRNIYIDLGANNGDSIKSFIHKVSNVDDLAHIDGSFAMKAQGGWQSILARPDKRSIHLSTWHIVAMEASNRHTDNLVSLAHNLTSQQQIASMKIYNGTAIGTANKSIKFYWDDVDKADAGATIMSDSTSATDVTEEIPMLDIVSLFRQERITVEDFVVIKMDIEGAEYDVVKRILMSGMYRYIDKMAVEWHHNAFFVFGKPENTEGSDYEVRLARYEKYKTRYEALMWMMEDSCCTPIMFDWG